MLDALKFPLFFTMSCLAMIMPMVMLWFYHSPPIQGQGLAWRQCKRVAKVIVVLYAVTMTWVMISPFPPDAQPESPCHAQ